MSEEEQFKENIKEIAKQTLKDSFTNNLMETLNSSFIFKYVDTLEQKNKKLQTNWNELKQFIESELSSKYIHKYDVLEKMQELEGKSE